MRDRIGEKYGRLEIVEFDELIVTPSNHYRYFWLCLCECGNVKSINFDCLKSGDSKSCGCLSPETTSKLFTKHGYRKKGKILSEYYCWYNMIQRCINPKNEFYHRYGGRGISVCQKWSESFENFIKDIGYKPSKKYSLDRINNDGNYEPSNCKWSTKIEQDNNRSDNKKVINTETNEEYLSISEAARNIGMHQQTLRNQLKGTRKNKTNLKLKEKL